MADFSAGILRGHPATPEEMVGTALFLASTDSDIFEHMRELCAKHRFPLCAMRTHAKLLLMAIGKHRYVIESSANMRSCHNAEQATMYDHTRLYTFHRRWICQLLEDASK